MAIRQYDFLVSVETPNTPTVADPASDAAVVNSGYLDDRWYWGASVASYAALRALTSTERRDNQIRNVDTGSTPELWKFDTASVTADDGATVLRPDDIIVSDPGRWHIMTTGGGGGGGGAAGLDVVLQKASLEKSSLFTDRIENTVVETFVGGTFYPVISLLENYTSGTTNLKMVVNPVFINPSDRPFDTTTNWTAINAGANLATSPTRKVGSTSLSFDKNGTNTSATLLNSTNTWNVPNNGYMYMWFNMPSITNFSKFTVNITPDNFTNFSAFDVTTDVGGNAIVVGWNLIRFDLYGTAAVTGGTGWNPTLTAAQVAISVVTSTAGQTYTGILLDAVCFGDSTGAVVQLGDKLTIYNNSTRSEFTIDSANSTYQGNLTISASMASSYTAGFGASDGVIARNTLNAPGDAFASSVTGLSGTIVNTQEFRSKEIFPENQGTFECTASIGFDTKKIFRVTSIPGGASIVVSDPANWSAQMTTGTKIHVVRPYFTGTTERYVPQNLNPTLTGNSTHSSGSTTINVPSTGIAVGDIIIRDQITASVSMVAPTANENFGAMTFDRLEVVDDGLMYPKPANVHGHWWLGGASNTEATRNRRGPSEALTTVGSLPQTRAFYNRQLASGFYSNTAYYTLSNASSKAISADAATSPSTGTVSVSIWIYPTATIPGGTTRTIVGVATSTPNGWQLDIGSATTNTPRLLMNNSVVTITGIGTVNVGAWNHIGMTITESAASVFYLNGIAYPFTAGPAADTPSTLQLRVGIFSNISAAATDLYLADLITWSNVQLTQEEMLSIYNQGRHRRVGPYDTYRKRFSATALAGQKLSIEATAARTTDADDIRFSHIVVGPS